MITIQGSKVSISTIETKEIKNADTLEFIKRLIDHQERESRINDRDNFAKGFREGVRKCEQRLMVAVQGLRSLGC